MTKVLVFPCGSEIGMEIFRALQYEKHIELWGGSSVPSNHGKFLFKNYIEGIPFVNMGNFIPELDKILKKYSIQYIFPAMDSVLLELSKNQERLSSKVIGSPYETNQVCFSKLKTYRLFRGKVFVPEVYGLEDLDDVFAGYPVFLKPEGGYGSRGTYIVKSRAEVSFYLERDPSLLILEYLPGKEYTVECFTDYQGRLRFVGGRERLRIQNGIAVHSRPVNHPGISSIAGIINNHLTFRGVWFFQLKENNKGELVLLEIASRAAGTMALNRNKGINLPLLSLYDAQENEVDIIENSYKIEIDRALTNRFKIDYHYQYVYVDFDDCILFKGKINTLLMMFLYQCINENKTIVLLSKHKDREDLENQLKTFRIDHLFDEIIHLSQEESKADYIKHFPAIFIDDSFGERRSVFKITGIPVFDLSSIESLIDWKF